MSALRLVALGVLSGLASAPGDAASPAIPVDYGYSPFLARIRTADVDAFILRDFPSYPTVLHDTGFRLGERIEYVYGWWCSASVDVNGMRRTLAGTDFVSRSVEAPTALRELPDRTDITLSCASVDVPEAVIDTTYSFFSGTPGVRVERTFRSETPGSAVWGPDGEWFGGPSAFFPCHQTTPPDGYYYRGQWFREGAHRGEPIDYAVAGDYAPWAVLYWESTGVWMTMLIEVATLETPFRRPELAFASRGVEMPGWRERVEPFEEGALTAWYLLGRGSRDEAVAQSARWFEQIAAAGRPEPGIAHPPGEVETAATTAEDVEAATPYVRLRWDATLGGLGRIAFSPDGSPTSSYEVLDGAGHAVRFTAGSQWQRSLDWHEGDARYLELHADTPTVDGNAMRLSGAELCDPETGEPWFRVDFEIKADEAAPSVDLTARATALRDAQLPYLGWHFDLPAGRFPLIHTGGWIHDVARWSRYRMGIMDTQPMRAIVAHDQITAYPARGADIPYAVGLAFLPDTDLPLRACNAPNPLFDEPRGAHTFAMTATETYWRYHNTRGVPLQSGATYTFSVRMSFPPADTIREPEYNIPRVRLPHAPDLEDALDGFWVKHCSGGPSGVHGVAAWWWSLGARYSPRFDPKVWRDSLVELMDRASDGRTVEVDGWVVPAGAIPVHPGRFDWNNGYLFDSNGQTALCAEEYYLATGDRAFLEQQIEKLERTCDFYASLADGRGVTVLPERFDGIRQYRATLFWDGWQIGCMSAHVQLYAAAASRAMARMERVLGRSDKAGEYDARADLFGARLIELFWRDSDIRDNNWRPLPGGRLAGWITADGLLIDPAFTDLSLMAVYLGLLPPGGDDAVLSWLDADPQAYAWRDRVSGEEVGAVAMNTVDGNSTRVYPSREGPRREYAGPFNPFATSAGMENGQVMHFVAGFDWYSRARHGRGDSAGAKAIQFLRRYARGDLTSGHGVPESRPLPMFQGTTQMSPDDLPCGSDQALAEDTVMFGLGILSGLFGLENAYEGLTVRPCVPRSFADAEITNLQYQGQRFTLRFRGYGSQVRAVTINGAPQSDTFLLIPFGAAPTGADPMLIEIELENAG